MKTEALKLADELDKLHQYVPSEAPAMIRKLVKELDKQTYKAELLENRLKVIVGSKPLSDDEIENIYFSIFEPTHGIGKNITNGSYEFARAIEERHGIK